MNLSRSDSNPSFSGSDWEPSGAEKSQNTRVAPIRETAVGSVHLDDEKYYDVDQYADEEDDDSSYGGIRANLMQIENGNFYSSDDEEEDETPEYEYYMQSSCPLEVMSDINYMQWVGLNSTPCEFPDPNQIDDELRALVAGVLMARGEKLDEGLTAEEFDIQLQEVTGKVESHQLNCIDLRQLGFFMNLSEPEFLASVKDKSNILLHRIFEPIVQYSIADQRFKLKLPPKLKCLYESIKASGMVGRKRREKTEKLKNDRMEQPSNRRKYMISNNMLVEMIAAACNRYFEEQISWQKIQEQYREMMIYENELFKKYDRALGLQKLRTEIGNELNEKSCRELFGRGTPSKALSHALYRKIKWLNVEKKGLVVSLDGGFNANPEECTYSQKDFEEIDNFINSIQHERQKECSVSQQRLKKVEQKRRETVEMEERKRHYTPVNLQPNDIFIPAIDDKDSFFGGQFRSDVPNKLSQQSWDTSMEKALRDDQDSRKSVTVRKNYDTVNFPILPSTNTHKNRFGSVNAEIEEDNISSTSGEPVERINFTDEEEEMKKNPSKPKEKTKKAASDSKQKPSDSLPSSRYRSQCEMPVENWDACVIPKNTSRKNGNLSVLNTHNSQQFLNQSEDDVFITEKCHMKDSRGPVPPRSSFTETTIPRPKSVRSSCQPAYLRVNECNGLFPSHSSTRVPSLSANLRNHSEMVSNNCGADMLDSDSYLFTEYIKMHIFLHRHIDGAPKRYWSQIRKSLIQPFNMPQAFFGPNWIQKLQSAVPNIDVVQVKNDFLFEWDEDRSQPESTIDF